MRVARKYGNLAGKVVHAYAKQSKTARGDSRVAELHAHLACLASALELEVGQSAVEHKHGIRRRPRSLKRLQRQGTVRREPYHAAIFKLNLGFSAVGRCKLHSFEQRRIGHRLL